MLVYVEIKVYSACCFFYRMLEKNAVFSTTELVV